MQTLKILDLTTQNAIKKKNYWNVLGKCVMWINKIIIWDNVIYSGPEVLYILFIYFAQFINQTSQTMHHPSTGSHSSPPTGVTVKPAAWQSGQK